MKKSTLSHLPIDDALPEILDRFRARGVLALIAEPGAGKTTRLPRALLDHGFDDRGAIVVLEPRRLATRMAAQRVADELGEKVGGRVGYQVRFDDTTGPRTRVRFVTEGILMRQLAADPTLEGVSTLVLDEFHERHLHGDLALAFARGLLRSRRPDLRIVVMSATLDAERVASFLEADVVRVPGRTHPVTIEHAATVDDRPLERQVTAALRRLLDEGLDGDVLVFLPGAAEIRRAKEACAPLVERSGLDLAVLHGDLPPAEQDRAVRKGDRPKVILSTNVAESSVTIEGVVAVIDSGLARVARHSPWSGLPSLTTVPISQASATQRAGRAGRLRPGRCFRLYTKHDHDTRPHHDDPEIRRADLAEPFLLLRAAGHDPASFPFFEPPPEAALGAADRLLRRVGAIDAHGELAPIGRRLLELPLHPRLARLVLEAETREVAPRGCLIAALASERDIELASRTRIGERASSIGDVGSSDLLARVEAFEWAEGERFRPERLRARGLDVGAVRSVARARDQLVRALARRGGAVIPEGRLHEEEDALLMAILAGFPDRVARRRNLHRPDLVFAGGGAGVLAPSSVVHDAELLVAIDADDRRSGPALVRLASAIEPEWLLELFPEHIEEKRELLFDPTSERIEETHTLRYDGIVLDETRRRDVEGPAVTELLAEAVLARGLDAVVDRDELTALRNRIEFAAKNGFAIAPLDDSALRAALRLLCEGCRSVAEVRNASLLDALRQQIGHATLARLDVFAPEYVALPGRRRVPVTYEADRPPFLASRLQDFFGLTEGPTVAGGAVPLVLHLLAPNQRAVQVTTDLAGFWERHYPALRKELMRRYPRHAWPDDPVRARPDRIC